MTYKSIIPADDWYLVANYPSDFEIKQGVFKIAAWALTDDNRVTGLISSCGVSNENDEGKPASLISLPPLQRGVGHTQVYKSLCELNMQERTLAGIS